MADPTPYVQAYSFSGFQATNPATPLPAPAVDNELANIETALDATQAALADIRRSDGALQDGVVTSESLATELLIEFADAASLAIARQAAVPVTGTSLTPVMITTGLLAFATQTNIGWFVGARLRVAATADPQKFVEGRIVSYLNGVVSIQVDRINGLNETYSFWNIGFAGEPGASVGMSQAIYDPRGIAGDVFNRELHTGRVFTPGNPTVPLEAANMQWVQALIDAVIPVGTVLDNPAPTLPAGNWIWATGAQYSRTGATAALFARYGTTYGVGNGSTTFNVPDRRGVVAAGVDNMANSGLRGLLNTLTGYATLGAVLGAQTHQLSVAQIPPLQFSGRTGTNRQNEAHLYRTNSGTYGTGDVSANGLFKQFMINPTDQFTGTQSENHDHDFVTNILGGGQAHNNTQPTVMTNFIIKY